MMLPLLDYFLSLALPVLFSLLFGALIYATGEDVELDNKETRH